jgi:hypothetical protein
MDQCLQQLKERVEAKGITAGTVKNGYQAIKISCETADIPIPWKKLRRSIPKVIKFADDRAPTKGEIQNMGEYPDRRKKSIVCTMASSGIRVGVHEIS